ncbi:VOC family protein [Dactylosporangium sp. NPDC051484]|uniref:VOC family protein n=1 Tax=Dactylosporangium sp. NPDC051484 TaxID=3154942 RepID=UPI00344C8935
MPSSNRASSSSGRNLVIALLILIGAFLAFWGLGESEPLMIGLGVVIAAAGPIMIMVLNSRSKVRMYLQATAVVEGITPRPSGGGTTGRGRLKLTVTTTGIRGTSVTGTDPAIPLDKWPEPGAVLPVRILKGTPRKFTVLWDRVQTHQEVVLAEHQRAGGSADDDHGYTLDGDDYGPASEDAYGNRFPGDDTPTLTNLPPIDAGIDEPVGARSGTRAGTAVADPVVVPAEQIPDAARRSARPSAPTAGPGRPRQAVTDPAHHPAEPLGAAATAVAFAESPAASPSAPTAASPAAQADVDAHQTDPGTTVNAVATPAASPGAAPTVSTTEDAEEQAKAETADAVEVVTEAKTGEPAEVAAEPKPGGAAEAAADEENASDAGPTTTEGPDRVAAPVAFFGTGAGQTVIGDEDEPIIMRLRSTPRPGGPHRRPSPHPRSGAHDRTRRPRTDRARPGGEPPAIPATDPATAYGRATEEITDGHDLIGTVAAPEEYTIPEGGSLIAATEVDPWAAWQTVAPGASRTPPAEAAQSPVPAASHSERETDQPPSRIARLDQPPLPAVIEGEAAQEALPAAEEPTARTLEPVIAEAEVLEPETAESEILEPETVEAEVLEPETTGTGATEPERVEAEIIEPKRPTGSAWSMNGRAPVGAGLYSAPPILRTPSTRAADLDDEDEAVTPNPYATEHYLPPEDQLEEQPLSEGAVAEFLATAPRQQAMPLDGVNGVSVTLIVSDLQRSRRFYRDTLGLTEVDSGETSVVLETGSARVVLRRVADMPPVDRRVVHLNLDVPDVYEAYERLREQGVDFVHRPRVVPQGEQLELCSATFRDPDGHAIALTRWELRR